MSAFVRFMATTLSCCAVATLTVTIASLPWMLGSIVPAARLSLLAGAILATVFSLLADVFRRKFSTTLPAVIIPIIALVLLGTLQLRPSVQSIAFDMHHAAVENKLPSHESVAYTHSLTSADTRSTIATLLALALLAQTALSRLNTQGTILISSLVFLTNAVFVTVIGMGELFGQPGLSLNEKWFLGWSHGKSTFAGFVNPNNAAGWLCLSVAIGAGWATWYLKPASTAPKLRHGRLRVSFFGRLWQRIVEVLADLTVWQTLAFAGITFLAAGVAATQSRGAILALLTAAVVTAVIRSSIRSLPLVLLLLALGGSAAFGFLRWLDLDRSVIGEMETLNDIGAASKIRVDHWLDSLNVVKDFPLTGTGLGSYRFATLPYQSTDAGVWFRYADNYYIDMIVEGGVVGFLLFIAIGACGLITGLASWQQSKTKTISRNEDTPRVSRRFMAGIGTAVMLATIAEACAAFFDYGIGLPAASALLIAMIASANGFLTQNDPSPTLRSTGSLHVGAAVVACVQLCLMAAAATYVPDQYAATNLDEAVVAGYRTLRPPVTAEKLEHLSLASTNLQRALKKRPDDAEGLRLLCLLQEAELRWMVLLAARGEQVRNAEDLNRQWQNLTLRSLVEQLKKVQQEDAAESQQVLSRLKSMIEKTGLEQSLILTQQIYPLMPGICTAQANIAVINGDIKAFDQQVAAVRFAESAPASALFEMGALALRIDRLDQADELWQQSLSLSDEFRTPMLTNAQDYWPMAELLKRFGPRNYSECVKAAKTAAKPDLAAELWARAEELWLELSQPVDTESSILRTDQLMMNRRHDEAFSWLQTAVKTHSENLPLLQRYADQLEKKGSYRDAMNEWRRIQFLDPGNTAADAAMTRIMAIKE